MIQSNNTLDRKVAEELENFCKETSRTKTKIVEMAISEFIEKYRNRPNSDDGTVDLHCYLQEQ